MAPRFSHASPLKRKKKGRKSKSKLISDGKPIEQYTHEGKDRVNNPPVGLVTPDTDKDMGRKTYSYDPHLDPKLVWAGKAEHTSFEVPTVSLHVHERIDPKTIIAAVRTNGERAKPGSSRPGKCRCSRSRRRIHRCATPSTFISIRTAGRTA